MPPSKDLHLRNQKPKGLKKNDLSFDGTQSQMLIHTRLEKYVPQNTFQDESSSSKTGLPGATADNRSLSAYRNLGINKSEMPLSSVLWF